MRIDLILCPVSLPANLPQLRRAGPAGVCEPGGHGVQVLELNVAVGC